MKNNKKSQPMVDYNRRIVDALADALEADAETVGKALVDSGVMRYDVPLEPAVFGPYASHDRKWIAVKQGEGCWECVPTASSATGPTGIKRGGWEDACAVMGSDAFPLMPMRMLMKYDAALFDLGLWARGECYKSWKEYENAMKTAGKQDFPPDCSAKEQAYRDYTDVKNEIERCLSLLQDGNWRPTCK